MSNTNNVGGDKTNFGDDRINVIIEISTKAGNLKPDFDVARMKSSLLKTQFFSVDGMIYQGEMDLLEGNSENENPVVPQIESESCYNLPEFKESCLKNPRKELSLVIEKHISKVVSERDYLIGKLDKDYLHCLKRRTFIAKQLQNGVPKQEEEVLRALLIVLSSMIGTHNLIKEDAGYFTEVIESQRVHGAFSLQWTQFSTTSDFDQLISTLDFVLLSETHFYALLNKLQDSNSLVKDIDSKHKFGL